MLRAWDRLTSLWLLIGIRLCTIVVWRSELIYFEQIVGKPISARKYHFVDHSYKTRKKER